MEELSDGRLVARAGEVFRGYGSGQTEIEFSIPEDFGLAAQGVQMLKSWKLVSPVWSLKKPPIALTPP